MKKIKIIGNFVIKYDVIESTGLERLLDFFSIPFNRELRIYRQFMKGDYKHLLIPQLFEVGSDYIKMERIFPKPIEIKLLDIISNIQEFLSLGISSKMRFSDYLSSPSLSIIRGTPFAVRYYGLKTHLIMILLLFKYTIFSFSLTKNYAIHKDLKLDQNMMLSEKGVYFFDFGSSVITKKYFLNDITDLSVDYSKFIYDPKPTILLLKEMNYGIEYEKIIKMQISLILYKRFLHLHKRDARNKDHMAKVKRFILECLNEVKNTKYTY